VGCGFHSDINSCKPFIEVPNNYYCAPFFMLLSFALLLFSNVVLTRTVPACGAIASDGSVYDLELLKSAGVISQIDNQNLWTYTISICQNIIKCDICPGAGYCQSGTLGGKPYVYCIGLLGSIRGLDGGAGVELIYTEPTGGRIGTVKIGCDRNGPLVSNKRAISPQKVTDYQFLFNSSTACINCSSTTTCRPCAAAGCNWCLDNSSCASLTPCRNFISNPTFCPNPCGKYNSCDTCTRGECAWCIGKNNCVDVTAIADCTNGAVRDPTFCGV